MEVDNEAIDDLDLGFTPLKPGASQKPPAERLNTNGIYLVENYISNCRDLETSQDRISNYSQPMHEYWGVDEKLQIFSPVYCAYMTKEICESLKANLADVCHYCPFYLAS